MPDFAFFINGFSFHPLGADGDVQSVVGERQSIGFNLFVLGTEHGSQHLLHGGIIWQVDNLDVFPTAFQHVGFNTKRLSFMFENNSFPVFHFDDRKL